jgi:lipoprotein-anchoring transpeptidase ErfK/SrfK
MTFSRRTLIAAAGAFALVLPASAGAGPTSSSVVAWSAPTPLPGKVWSVAPGTRLKLQLAAAAPGGEAVRVEIRPSSALPAGSSLQPADGNPARATFSWKPSAAHTGDHRVTFTATVAGLPVGSAPPRTFVVRVKQLWPKRALLSDYSAEMYRWAFVVRRTAVRSGPSRGARVVNRLSTVTPEYFPNLVQTMDSVQLQNGQTWVRVRLAVLPNSATGWVRRGALGRYRMVRTRLVVDRGRLRATLFRAGKPIFRSIIGVGQSRWPTPRGHFYVREVLTGYNMPVYGPVAMGLSARSPVLTDWPGGGFIGIHGTNAPGILPGRVSHGCIRMPNGNILRLRRLMPLGTLVQVR